MAPLLPFCAAKLRRFFGLCKFLENFFAIIFPDFWYVYGMQAFAGLDFFAGSFDYCRGKGVGYVNQAGEGSFAVGLTIELFVITR